MSSSNKGVSTPVDESTVLNDKLGFRLRESHTRNCQNERTVGRQMRSLVIGGDACNSRCRWSTSRERVCVAPVVKILLVRPSQATRVASVPA